MVPRSVCDDFESCLFIVLFITAVSSLDITETLDLESDRDLYTHSNEDYSDDQPILPRKEPDMEVAKEINNESDFDFGTEIIGADEKTNALSSNEVRDETDNHENIKTDDVFFKNINNNDKHKKTHPSVQDILPPAKDEFDVKKLAALPGLKLSSTDMAKFKIWPEAKIPFFIDDFSYDKVLRDKIRGYLGTARALSGLNFVELSYPPQDENVRWVFFVNRRGQLDCKDYSTKSFTNTGVQRVIIGYDCLRNNGPIAAIVLALAGVPPQHNSPDRDRYINISMNSILPEKRILFKRLNAEDWLFSLPYDYYSVAHYPSHKYTADGSATLTALIGGLRGSHKIFYMKHDKDDTYSNTDILKIRLLYNNILQNLPRPKPELCKYFYQPRARYMKLNNSRNRTGPVVDDQVRFRDTTHLPPTSSIRTARENKLLIELSSIEDLNEIYGRGKK